MTRRDPDPSFDPEQIESQDPLGEESFESSGFQDAPGGGPDHSADELADAAVDRRAERSGQKVAGIPKEQRGQPNSSDLARPDSSGVVIRERGGSSKGDPAAGGTRPD